MKNKNKNQTKTIETNLESLIQSHAQFVTHLTDLIPPRFLSQNDDADSKPWFQGLSKQAKASLKRQTKKNIKESRRQRFDPDFKPTQVVETPADDVEENDVAIDDENKSKTVTYEELRLKLRKKIESLRGNRFDSNRSNRGEKRKLEGVNWRKEGENVRKNDENDEEEVVIEYGKVRVGDEENVKKKRKVSKVKELEKAEKLKETKKENFVFAEKETWKAAESRAMGVKVHDNAKLIKESIKKDKKKKEKNAEKWKERVESREKMMEDRQRKRKDNIVGRINENKQRKIAKREKKLMRPGFEGRKDGFITEK